MMKVTIDPSAGFCFGVKRAIDMAEQHAGGPEQLFSLGELVHNEEEVNRLRGIGVRAIDQDYMMNLKQGKVLFRAHGEPPVSYRTACRNNSTVVDATCPVVKKLQANVLKAYNDIHKKCGMVLIFGKSGHPEVAGLNGQINNEAMVISSAGEITNMDLPPVIRLFSQTTMGTEEFARVKEAIAQRLQGLYPGKETDFKASNSICGQVSGREKKIRKFAAEHQVILFVGGKHSSNGKHLFGLCKEANPRTYYLSGKADLDPEWLRDTDDVGISGATSTPDWLLEEIAKSIQER